MSVLRVRLVGEEILRFQSNPVQNPDTCQKLIDSMLETVRQSESAVALAAPQVGHLVRLFVFAERADEPKVFINPAIEETIGEIEVSEGCLSIPNFYPMIRRGKRVRGSALNRWGEPIEFDEGDLLGHAIQHEVAHLNGELMIDLLSLDQKRELLKRMPPELHKIRKGLKSALMASIENHEDLHPLL